MTRSGTRFYARYSSSRVLIELVGVFARLGGAGQFGSGKIGQNFRGFYGARYV